MVFFLNLVNVDLPSRTHCIFCLTSSRLRNKLSLALSARLEIMFRLLRNISATNLRLFGGFLFALRRVVLDLQILRYSSDPDANRLILPSPTLGLIGGVSRFLLLF